jgi:uncharacterized membrane protein
LNARISKGLWAIAALLSVGVALYSYRYLLPHESGAPGYLTNRNETPWLPVHAACGATALMLGPFQFIERLRIRRRDLHRLVGRTYVAACLVGGVAGLVLALGSLAGPIATAGFGSLAAVWFSVNLYAWRLAVSGRFAEHRRWMIRSFALTFGAVLLRLYLPMLPVLGIAFLPGYRAISFLSWVPNLIAVELWFAWRGARAQTPAAV